MAEESVACPFCGEAFQQLDDYWKHVQSADCGGKDFPQSKNIPSSGMLHKPPDAAFLSQPLAPSAFRSPDTTTSIGSIPLANSEKVGSCMVCGLTFYAQADLKAHLASEEHKARIPSASVRATKRTKAATCKACDVDFNNMADLKTHIISSEHKAMVESVSQSEGMPFAAKKQMADCKLCGLNFYDPTEFKEHIASPEHTARLEGASQQEKPVSISTRPLRCMCCDVTFASKSELQQHLATPEHKHHAELMRQSNVKLPCTSSASGKTAATNINSCTGYGNEVQPVVNPSSSLSLGTLPESEELTALVGKLCEEMRPFIRSEICRLLEPICAPQVNASSPPTTVPNHPVIISKDGGLYCTVCHCSVPGSGGGAEQHLLGKKHQSKL